VSRTARVLRAIGRIAYGVYAWIALAAIVLPLCGALAVTPGLTRRRRLARAAARLFLWAIGSPVRLAGEPPAAHDPCVVVANHASYLDGIILTAALPPSFTYLIKHEMARLPIAGFLLKRLGSAFVNRADAVDRNRTARRLLELAASGDALAFFPEGTFDAVPGLKPFQAGAFGAAARAKLPIVPLVIRGSRHKLPSGAFLAAPGGQIWVCVCGRVETHELGSTRIVMVETRRLMLAHLDEPDLTQP
jgi:1-acyl-sn-glycerol-3-phosphate acyltransferase